MRKITVKIPAKLNLTLDIKGINNGYHELDSLFISVNVFDTVIARKRKDGEIRLSFCGVPIGVSAEKSNAYKAAKAFVEKFNTLGADIVVKRKIPAGGGMGGSSADAAGTLKALAALYGVNDGVKDIADAIGSDVAFMLDGGFARVRGRGTDVTPIDTNAKIYFLLLTGGGGVSSAECYKRYDLRGETYTPCTDEVLTAVKNGDYDFIARTIKNDLALAAQDLAPEIGDKLAALKPFGSACVTGSGSTVFAVFGDKKARNVAYKRLKKSYGKAILKAETPQGAVM